jgi:7-cyano-7-deazaguanine synthase
MTHYVIALSGGLDSTTLLAYILRYLDEDRSRIIPVHFQYGSKHNEYEEDAIADVLAYYGIVHSRLRTIHLEEVFSNMKSSLLKSGGEIPEGHYEAESMRQTVVPGRNLIFMSIMAGIAESVDCDRAVVALGVHEGDHAIYPDCREEFIASAEQTILHSTDRKVYVYPPFLRFNKKKIVRWGTENMVPYILTRTCYKDQPIACGKCGSCQERLEAFASQGLTDPLQYESREILPKSPPGAE